MIRFIILLIVGMVILSYFGVSIRSVTESDIFQENFSYVWNYTSNSAKFLWNNHLAGPARYLWYDIFLKVIWSAFTENMDRIKAGKDMEMLDYAPSVNFGE